MHLVKIKIPGKSPTMPLGRKIVSIICLDSIALNEYAEKKYRKCIDPTGGLPVVGLVKVLSIDLP